MNKNRIFNIIGLVANVAVVTLTTFGMLKFINSFGAQFSPAETFKRFEIIAICLLGLASLFMIFVNIKNLISGKNSTPRFFSSMRFIVTSLSVIAFVVNLAVIGPKMEGFSCQDYLLKFENGSLFLNLICPAISLLLFIFVESKNKIRFRKTFAPFGLVILYSAVIVSIGLIMSFVQNIQAAQAFLPKEYFFFFITPQLAKLVNPDVTFTTNIIYLAGIIVGSYLVGLVLFTLNHLLNSLLFKDKEHMTQTAPNSVPVVSPTPVQEIKVSIDTPEIQKTTEPVVAMNKEEVAPAATTPSEPEWTSIKTINVEPIPVVEETNITTATTKKTSTTKPKTVSRKINYNRVYHISLHDRNRKTWKVKIAGNSKALKVFPTQKEAIDYTKDLIKKSGGSIRIHTTSGKMRKK